MSEENDNQIAGGQAISQLLMGNLGAVVPAPGILPSLLGPDGQPIPGLGYVWRPEPALKSQVPPGLEFALHRFVCPDGIRRFRPVSANGMIATGFAGGLAVLSAIHNPTPEQHHSYGASYLLFQRVRQTREHFDNQLLNTTSLRRSRVGRDVADERDILPESLGLDAAGNGERWDVDRLYDEGKRAAREAGVTNPTEQVALEYGFLEAARRNPLYLDKNEVPQLVRLTLYESCGEELDPELMAEIEERTLSAMANHLDEPAPVFDNWFQGKANLLQQIGRRKLRPLGVLDQDVVRRALQELGWQSYQYVGDCIDLQIQAFLKAIPDLTDEEQRWFKQMHCKQPYFGGLPLVLVFERFTFLRKAIWEVWQNPGNREAVAVLHRLMDYYRHMASERRAVDRLVKQRRPQLLKPDEKSPLTVELPAQTRARETSAMESDEESSAGEEPKEIETPQGIPALFDEIAEVVRTSRGIICGCPDPDWESRSTPLADGRFAIHHCCLSCQFSANTELSPDQLKEIGEMFK